MKHLELLHNTYSPFPRRSSVVFLVAQHHVNSEFVQRLVVLASSHLLASRKMSKDACFFSFLFLIELGSLRRCAT